MDDTVFTDPATETRVSIVIPTLAKPEALERTICSVLDQVDPDDTLASASGHRSVEAVLVDDGSCQETSYVLAQYADQCRVLQCSNHKGPAQAIQVGLDAAKGRILGVLMPGDLLLPGALHEVEAAFARPQDTDWLVLDGIHIDATGQQLNHEPLEAPQDLETLLLHRSGDLPMSGAFFRSAVVRDQAALDISLHEAFGYEYACRLMAQGIAPRVLSGTLIARRQQTNHFTPAQVIERGLETLDAAHQYTEYLPLRQRTAVWSSLDERARIYTLAESETKRSHARGHLWRKLLRHPWWLADEHYRHGLIHGLPQTKTSAPGIAAETAPRMAA